ncbi:phage tail protein [Pseudomonas alkylphenolica]|uniref:phage tail protein n=1 Tax=Pseudomonas alkylphenolica TaxID=237609 RepID=UPI001E371B5C|nr:phage tail protein [Pseudomonas alkylphenolica]
MAVTYYAILTTLGAAKLANAAAIGTTLQITQMVLGDGNGEVPVPDANRTALVNEVRRAPLNRLSIDASNAAQIIAEQVIPETVGGWWIREIGLLDSTGTLIAIANCAPSYKPQLSEGSGRTQTVRMVLIVNNTGAVELKIDPSVVLATREYVDTAIVAAMNRQDAKASVRVATTANIGLNGLQTVDGVVLVAGDRVLVKSQSIGSQNGIYVVATGAWARSADNDENADVTAGMIVPVESGTQNSDTIWQLITDAPIVVGITALVFRNITDGLARLLSPAFVGSPTAPTPVDTDSSGLLATTKFVSDLLGKYGVGVSQLQPAWPNASLNDCTNVRAGSYRVTAAITDIPAGFGVGSVVEYRLKNGVDGQFQAVQLIQSAQFNKLGWRSAWGTGTFAAPAWDVWKEAASTVSPAFTGLPTAPTASLGDKSPLIANTAFVRLAMEQFGLGAAQYQPNWPNASLNDCTGVNSGKYRTIASTTDMPPGFGTSNIIDYALRSGVEGTFQVVQTVVSAQFNKMAQRFSTAGTSTAPAWSEWREFAFTESPIFTGDPKAPTPPQFDNDTSLATTEFVRRALGSFSGARSVTAATLSLPVSDVGKFVALTSGAAQTVSLPLLADVPVGATITLHNSSAVDKTITVNGNDKLSPDGGMHVYVTLKRGDTISATSEAGVWRLHGVGVLKYSDQFTSVLGAAAASQQLPGLSIKAGNVSNTSTAASIPLTFPVAFPVACVALVLVGWAGNIAAYTHTGRDRSGAEIQRNANSVFYFDYIAIGY